MIDHILILNEKKKADWIDPQLILTQQIIINDIFTLNIAYLQKYDLINQLEDESLTEFNSFRRERYLSDNITQEQDLNNRKTSFHDLDGMRQYKKNKEIIKQAIKRRDSLSTQQGLLTIINKKDDVEILSSIEGAEKIIDQGEDNEFEIIIEEQPIITGSTLIVKSKELFNPLIDFIIKLKEKDHQFSDQISENLHFIQEYEQ